MFEIKSMFSWISNKFYHVDHSSELYVIYSHFSGLGDLGTIIAEVILGNIGVKRNRGLWILFKFKNLTNTGT